MWIPAGKTPREPLLYKAPDTPTERWSKALSFVLALLAVFIAREAVQAQSGVSFDENTKTLLISTAMGVFTLIVTQLVQMWREYRNRKWDLQDRKIARDEMRADTELAKKETLEAARLVREAAEAVAAEALRVATELRQTQQATARELARANSAHHQKLETQGEKIVEKATVIEEKADAAYNAANNFANKRDALKQDVADTSTAIASDVKAIAEDVHVTAEVATALSDKAAGK